MNVSFKTFSSTAMFRTRTVALQNLGARAFREILVRDPDAWHFPMRLSGLASFRVASPLSNSDIEADVPGSS